MGAEFSDLADGLKRKREEEQTSKTLCARLNTAAFADGLGRVRIGDGACRAAVAKSERDRIRDLDLTPLCVLKLHNFEDDVHHNECLSIYLGLDHETEEDGEKVFLHYIVRLHQQHADKCTCPKFCSLHGMGPMMRSRVSHIAGIEHDAWSIKDNMRYLIHERIFDPFKANKVLILSDQDRHVLVARADSRHSKFTAFSRWIGDFLARDVELVAPKQLEPGPYWLRSLSIAPKTPAEEPGDAAWKSHGFDDMMQQYKGELEAGSFYARLRAERCECTASPAKKQKLAA